MAALGIGAIRIRSMAGCVARRSETVRANSEMQIERHRVDPAGRGLVCELGHGGHDPAPSRRPSSSPASASSLARAALSSSALSPQRLIMSCATRPNVDLRDQSRRLMKSPPGPPMTLGNAEASRVRLIVWCKACGHQVEPEPVSDIIPTPPYPRSIRARVHVRSAPWGSGHPSTSAKPPAHEP
jgi:hypothetical protein